MSELRYYIAVFLLASGVLACAVSILGVFRFRFVMNRMHCAAILDTLAMACILGGLMVLSGRWVFILKLLAALLVLWVSSPIASHLVGRMEIDTDKSVARHIAAQEENNHELS